MNSVESDVARAVQHTLAAMYPKAESGFDWRESFPIQRAKDAIDKGHGVLLVGGGPDMRLTRDSFLKWLEQLPPQLPISLAGDLPNAEQMTSGIGWVLRLFPADSSGSEMHFESAPPSDLLRGLFG